MTCIDIVPDWWRVIEGDSLHILRTLPDQSINCCVTSPPYWGMREYLFEGAVQIRYDVPHEKKIEIEKELARRTTGFIVGITSTMSFYHRDDIPADLKEFFEPAPQLGLERTPEEYVANIVKVFQEVRRVLRNDGTVWLNLGDSYFRDPMKGDRAGYLGLHKNIADSGVHKASQYRSIPAGLKPKDLVGIPWLVAFALRRDGWHLRQDIIWSKPSPMPESVTDRCTKAHEYIFLLSKSPRYYFDADAIAEPCVESNDARPRMGQGPNTQYEQKRDGNEQPASYRGSSFTDPRDLEVRPTTGRKPRKSVQRGEFNGKTNTLPGREAFRAIAEMRNKRSVWTVATVPSKRKHFAMFPPDLIRPCILAGCPDGGDCT